MPNNLELKDYLNIINAEIQIKQNQIESIKPNFYPLLAIFVGFIASSTITTVKSDITSFWFLLGLITITFLSINKYLVHRRMFILKNKGIIENQKVHPEYTRLIWRYFKQTYFTLIEGFLLITLLGFFESFLFPSAFAQIGTLMKDFFVWIVLCSFLFWGLLEIYGRIIRKITHRENEIVFSDWLTKHSVRFENMSFTYGVYATLIFGSMIILFWKNLGLKNFGYELLLYFIFIGTWVIVIQMINLTNVVNEETHKLNFLNKLKVKVLFEEISAEKISKSIMMTNVTRLEKESLFLFFSYCYYCINQSLVDNLEPNDIKEFFS